MDNRLQIPAFLFGKYRAVSGQVRRVAERALASGCWAEILEESQGFPMASLSGGIVMDCSFRQRVLVQTENIVVCTLFEALVQYGGSWPDREKWYKTQADLLDEGLEYFWFSLCLLAAGIPHLPFMQPPISGSYSRRNLARRHLEKLFGWAEMLDANQHRLMHCNGARVDTYDGPAFEGMIGDAGFMDKAPLLHSLPMVRRRDIVKAWIIGEG